MSQGQIRLVFAMLSRQQWHITTPQQNNFIGLWVLLSKSSKQRGHSVHFADIWQHLTHHREFMFLEYAGFLNGIRTDTVEL